LDYLIPLALNISMMRQDMRQTGFMKAAIRSGYSTIQKVQRGHCSDQDLQNVLSE
jgi:hypothetical protein